MAPSQAMCQALYCIPLISFLNLSSVLILVSCIITSYRVVLVIIAVQINGIGVLEVDVGSAGSKMSLYSHPKARTLVMLDGVEQFGLGIILIWCVVELSCLCRHRQSSASRASGTHLIYFTGLSDNSLMGC